MNCVEIQERLSAGIDGELIRSEAEEVSRHLGACTACGRRNASLRAARDAFRTARRTPRPLRSIAVAGLAAALLLTLAVGRGLRRGPAGAGSPRGEGAAVAIPFADREGIDCGLRGATVCVVDQPCADGRCDAARAGLGPF